MIKALEESGVLVESGYSNELVSKYVKNVVVYEEYVLVDIFD